MAKDLDKCIEELLRKAPNGLGARELAEDLGEDEERLHELLWRTGRGRGLVFDGAVWQRGSAGATVPPLMPVRPPDPNCP